MAKKIIARYSAGALNQIIFIMDTETKETQEYDVPMNELSDFIVGLNPDEVCLLGSPSFFQKYKNDIEQKGLTQYNKKIKVNLKTGSK